MIVPSMTEEQLLEEIKLDFKNIYDTSTIKKKKAERIVRTSSVFPVRLHSFITSKRKNNWLILWEAHSKKNIGDKSIVSFICYYDSTHGKYAVMPTIQNRNILLIKYAPHFFQRFAQRMNLDLSGIDLIKRYFEYNTSYGFQYENVQDESGMVQVFGSTDEGIAMGVMSTQNNVILIKTFITYEMTKGEQIKDFARNNQLRKEIDEAIG